MLITLADVDGQQMGKGAWFVPWKLTTSLGTWITSPCLLCSVKSAVIPRRFHCVLVDRRQHVSICGDGYAVIYEGLDPSPDGNDGAGVPPAPHAPTPKGLGQASPASATAETMHRVAEPRRVPHPRWLPGKKLVAGARCSR